MPAGGSQIMPAKAVDEDHDTRLNGAELKRVWLPRCGCSRGG